MCCDVEEERLYRIEHNGEVLEFRAYFPEARNWYMDTRFRLQCPDCHEFITADIFFPETCPCGRLTRTAGRDTVQVAGYPVGSVALWRVIPAEVLAEDGLIEVLGRILVHARRLGDGQLAKIMARDRRLLAAGNRQGAREVAETLLRDVDHLLEVRALDDPNERQALGDLALRAVSLANAVLTSERQA